MPTAQMRVPAGLETAPTLAIEGIGGGPRGSYRVGHYTGTFDRSADAFTIGHPTSFQRGRQGIRFSMQGPGITGSLEVDCDASEFSITHDDLSLDLEPRRFRCAFLQDGRREVAQLVVNRQPSRGLSEGLAMVDAGELVWNGIRVEIRSTNRLQGSVFTTEDPAGYIFSDRGHPIGAVNVAGTRTVTLAPDAYADVRVPVMVASVALALVWV